VIFSWQIDTKHRIMGRGAGSSTTKSSPIYLYSPYIHLKLFYTWTCITIHTLIARLRDTNSISCGWDLGKYTFLQSRLFGLPHQKKCECLRDLNGSDLSQTDILLLATPLMNYQEQMCAILLVNFNLHIFNLYIYMLFNSFNCSRGRKNSTPI
jgi:hypothetical protein